MPIRIVWFLSTIKLIKLSINIELYMQASVENTSAIGRKMSVVVPADQIETAIQTKLNQLSKQV